MPHVLCCIVCIEEGARSLLRLTIFILALGFASNANAQDCPAFFRFADFGLKTDDGTVYRGGPVFRAEGFDGSPLLLAGGAQCLSVPVLAKDGRGNIVPVVSSISYDPQQTGIALTELRVSSADDAVATADANAAAHLAAMGEAETIVTQGPNYLCAHQSGSLDTSCQIASPYPGNTALVVYCNVVKCNMPVLAINDRIYASAAWARADVGVGDQSDAAQRMLDRISQIQGFLAPLASGI